MIAQIGKIGEASGGVHRFKSGLVRELSRLNIPCNTIEGRDGNIFHRLLTTWMAGRRVLAGSSIELVASHFALYAWPLLHLLDGRPLVVHHHGPWALESQYEGDSAPWVARKRQIELDVYGRASHLITLSEAFATSLHVNYGIARDRIRVIPGAVDLDRFSNLLSRSEARARLGWPANRPIIVTVRRLVKRMGLPVLINAISEVRRRHPDVLVQICGDGHLRSTLASQVTALGLEHHIKLPGYIDESSLPLVYRAADLSVVPSTDYEGFGLAVAESLAAGTPTVASDLDGLPEILRPLSPSLLVTPGSVDELADRICQILSGGLDIPSEAACRNYAAQRYAWPLIVEQILAVYREAMQQPPSPLSTLRLNDALRDIAKAG